MRLFAFGIYAVGFDARIALAEPLFVAVAAYAGYRGIYS
jgi:hypothetical protein